MEKGFNNGDVCCGGERVNQSDSHRVNCFVCLKVNIGMRVMSCTLAK